jgi:DNA-binding GntR family transcriptional regulator
MSTTAVFDMKSEPLVTIGANAARVGADRIFTMKSTRKTKKKSNQGTRSAAGVPPVVRLPGLTANARAYSQLKQEVLSGRFRPGEVVTLRAVTELLGAGEMAAREAVKRLISEGAFKALPNRSARVPVLQRREIMQFCELRALLESGAAASAAGNITLHQIEALRGMNARMVACVSTGNLEEYKRLNKAFHFEIYRIADNAPLSALIESLWLAMAPFISYTINWATTIPGRFERIATSHHDELLLAFQNRNMEGARAAMHRDIAEIHETEGYWAAFEDWVPDVSTG